MVSTRSRSGRDVFSTLYSHSEKKKKRVSFLFIFTMSSSYSGGGGGNGLADKIKSTNWRALGRNISNKVKQYAMNLSPLEVQVEEGACVRALELHWCSGVLVFSARSRSTRLSLTNDNHDNHDQRPTWIRGVRMGR